MLEFNQMVTKQRRWMLYFLIILLIGWIATPYKKFFFSFFLGGIISFINMNLLQKKVKDLGESVIRKKATSGLGFLLRFLLIALTVVFAMKFTHFIHLGSTLMGLMSSYVVIPAERFFHSFKEVKELEKSPRNTLNGSSENET